MVAALTILTVTLVSLWLIGVIVVLQSRTVDLLFVMLCLSAGLIFGSTMVNYIPAM